MTVTAAPLAALLTARPEVELPATAERAWRLHRHGLAERAADLDQLARRHVGLHAARQLTPWMLLHSRLPGLAPQALRATMRDRGLVRVRCMRRTLHLLPIDLAAIAHTATLRQRLSSCELASRRLGLTGARARRLTGDALAMLADGPRPYNDLMDALAPGTRLAVADPARLRARQTLKNLWEAGELVIGDASETLHHEQRTFARVDLELGADALRADPLVAVYELLRHYLRAYGPVAPRDFAWWSGIATREAAPAWEALADELVRVRVDGIDIDMVALGSTIAELLDGDWSARPVPRASVLAYEDPSLKGYFATRARYVAPATREMLFNSIGEARASVMLDGIVAAVWSWDRERQAAVVNLSGIASPRDRELVEAQVSATVAYLRSEPRDDGAVPDRRLVRRRR